MILLSGGVAIAVQTFAAQAFGAGRYRRAASAAWNGAWAALLIAPLLVLVGWSGQAWLPRIGLDPAVASLAAEYWWPRCAGAGIGLVLWAVQSFFNGTSQVRTTLLVNLVVVTSNAAFNEILMFRFGWGVAGAAWATNLAQAVGVVLAFGWFFRARALRARYATHLTWRFRPRLFWPMLAIGMPIGLSISFDLLGLAAFQLIMTRVGVIEGAATQVVMMLTSIAFMPAIGLCMAGTTLVGQSIGAGSRQWAWRVGNRVILMSMLYMGGVGLLIALAGPVMLPWFAGDGPEAGRFVVLGGSLLWIAACYQLFDGAQLGCSFCLRGAGDTRFVAIVLLVLVWTVYLPLTHWLTFAPGAGFIPGLGGLGGGALGGWWAAVVHVGLLALAYLWRWRSRRWMALGKVGAAR